MFTPEIRTLTHRAGGSSTARSHAWTSLDESKEGYSTSVTSTSKETVVVNDGIKRRYQVVKIEETATFLRFNRHINSGYRMHPLPMKDALYSMVGYLHNETANIYTHLFGAVLFTYFILTNSKEWKNNNLHYASITIYDVSSAVCLFFSVAYHTLMNSAPSEKEYQRLMLFDMYGIWFINTGAAFSLSYTLLPCSSSLVHLGLIVVPAVCSLLWIMLFSKTPMQRVLAFGMCWALRFLTIVGTYVLDLAHWTPSLLLMYVATELLPLVGGIINVTRFPEAIYPGRFDYFHSHTLMHILTVMSMIFEHYLSEYRASHIIDTDYVLSNCVADGTARVSGFLSLLFGSSFS